MIKALFKELSLWFNTGFIFFTLATFTMIVLLVSGLYFLIKFLGLLDLVYMISFIILCLEFLFISYILLLTILLRKNHFYELFKDIATLFMALTVKKRLVRETEETGLESLKVKKFKAVQPKVK